MIQRFLPRPALTGLALAVGLTLASCGTHGADPGPATDGSGGRSQEEGVEADAAPTVQAVEVVNRFPHDPRAFTQGLLFADGRLLESTGRRGTSWLREVRLESGAVVRQKDLEPRFFGEGLALHGGELFQLTWTSRKVFVYDRRTFENTRELKLKSEGWGITGDGEHLFVSDGTATIRVLDPADFSEVRTFQVTSGGQPVPKLNELEMVEGELYANIWKLDHIARIDPQTGVVKGWLDLSGIVDFPRPRDPDAVLNGIAYDPVKKRLFVTGKLWPALYEIRPQAAGE